MTIVIDDTSVEVEPAAQPFGDQPWIVRFRRLAASTSFLVWSGFASVALGLGLLALTWSQVAGRIEVARQLPYFISGGVTALCFVMIGVTLARIGADRRDSQDLLAEFARLQATMAELRTVIESGPPPDVNSAAPVARAPRRKVKA